jgi:hypothetical protein
MESLDMSREPITAHPSLIGLGGRGRSRVQANRRQRDERPRSDSDRLILLLFLQIVRGISANLEPTQGDLQRPHLSASSRAKAL